MPLADIVEQVEKPDDIICKRWAPIQQEERKCRHFLAQGPCALEEEFMCLEYLRAKGMLHAFELSEDYSTADIHLGELHASARRLRLAKGGPDRMVTTSNASDPPASDPVPPIPSSKLETALAKLKKLEAKADTKSVASPGLVDALAKLKALQ